MQYQLFVQIDTQQGEASISNINKNNSGDAAKCKLISIYGGFSKLLQLYAKLNRSTGTSKIRIIIFTSNIFKKGYLL